MTLSITPWDFLEAHSDKWMPEPNSGCWIWFGAQVGHGVSFGYGSARERGKHILAHRQSYADANNYTLRKGDVVRHRCDSPWCVNPDHLLIGTMKDNSQDAIARGRWNPGKGERHKSNVLTEQQVRDIRATHSGGHGQTKAMAEQYGVSRRTIHQIVARETWGWLC
jgi:hypothetical protein